jgi:hypothetical protein
MSVRRSTSVSNGIQLNVDLGGKPTREAPILDAMRYPIETAVKQLGLEKFVPKQQPEQRSQSVFSAEENPVAPCGASHRRHPFPGCDAKIAFVLTVAWVM